MISRAGTRRAAMAAILIAILTATGQYAQAQPTSREEGPQYAPTMLILDGSGSMQRPDQAGTMMDAAKTAVHSFVDSAPAEARIGLMAYGTGTGNTEAEKQAGCRDVRVLQTPDALDREALHSAVDGIDPSGWTPMGPALREAADTLPSSGPRSIVLVSDGEDTCAPPDVCTIAKELNDSGIDLVVHTIGFAVDAAARAQLTCVAQSTGGTYTDAADGAALKQILPRVSAAALRNYQPAGTPITGTANYDTAPVATPGQHLDTLGQHETRYWAVDVPDDATAYFSGTVSFPRLPGIDSVDDTNVIRLQVYGEDGRDCHTGNFEQATYSSDGVALTVAEIWTGATEKRDGKTSADKCTGGGRYYFALSWSTVSKGVPERLPLELLIGIEPSVTDGGPVATPSPVEFREPTGADTTVTGGGSFNTAATLSESGRYVDAVRPGEFVFYKVWLDWGRGLAYRVHFPPNGGKGLDSVANLRTAVYSPIREEIDSSNASYTGTENTLPGDGAMNAGPVRYRNRDSDDAEIRQQSAAGWYYIAVKVGSTFTDKGEQQPIPVQLDLTVDGDEESGPTYTEAADIFGENTAPKAADSATDTNTDSNTLAAAEESSSSNWMLVAGIGLGAVLVLGAVSAIVIRRRRG
ncbi:MAG: VWA domain-containing protein [Rhodococcus sp.]|nr:VWA domain-containing protein [Rhodococcus sp. (in: high G+C Gram-positive bacteria)]